MRPLPGQSPIPVLIYVPKLFTFNLCRSNGLFPINLQRYSLAAGRYFYHHHIRQLYTNKKKLLEPLHTIAILINFISSGLFSSSISLETIFSPKYARIQVPSPIPLPLSLFWNLYPKTFVPREPPICLPAERQYVCLAMD